METLRNFFLSPSLWMSLLSVAAAVLLWTLLRKGMETLLARSSGKSRYANNARVAMSLMKYLLVLITVIFVLEINGVNVSSLVAGLGVAGIVVGFALQDMLKDIVMGANILMDDFFSAGDIVSYGSIALGEVVSFNMKATRIRDLDNGNVVTVSNRNITEITRVSDWQIITVPAPYEEHAERMRAVCAAIAEEAAELDPVRACSFLGTGALAESCIEYKLKVISDPAEKFAARRAVLGLIQDVFERENITIPYTQVDVHLER